MVVAASREPNTRKSFHNTISVNSCGSNFYVRIYKGFSNQPLPPPLALLDNKGLKEQVRYDLI